MQLLANFSMLLGIFIRINSGLFHLILKLIKVHADEIAATLSANYEYSIFFCLSVFNQKTMFILIEMNSIRIEFVISFVIVIIWNMNIIFIDMLWLIKNCVIWNIYIFDLDGMSILFVFFRICLGMRDIT